jgi:hypothetical protein
MGGGIMAITIGSIVRPTFRGIATGRLNVGMTGTVFAIEGEAYHVNWGEGFVGHTIDTTDGHNGHCYWMDGNEVEIVEQTIMANVNTVSYNPAEFVEGFPPGTVVENIGTVALGVSSSSRFSQTIRGTVIANVRREAIGGSLNVHVDFGEEFNGHREFAHGNCTGHCYFLYPHELRVVSMPLAEVAVVNEPLLPVSIPRLRVSIDRRADRYGSINWQLTVVNGPIPTKYEIKEYLDKGIVRRLGRRTWIKELEYIIIRAIDTYGVDPAILVEAVTQASLAKQAREATGSFSNSIYDRELQLAMATQPAIIAIGDQLFTLQPKGAIKAGRAMAAIRERIVGSARDNAIKIKATGQLEAAAVISNAERQLRLAREQIAKERAALTSIMTIPQWIADNYIKVRKWDSSVYKMAVGMEISTKVNSFSMTHYKTTGTGRGEVTKSEIIKWNRNLDGSDQPIVHLANYHTVTIWLPFDHVNGSYVYKSAKIIEVSGYQLPHLTSSRCCMELQGLPERMTDIDSYRRLQIAINRGSSEVNMMSLLSTYNNWHPDIQAQCPVNLKKIIDMGVYKDAYNLDDSLFADAERVPVEVEARETFNVESLREARRARGEELADINIGEDGVEDVAEEAVEEDEHLEVIDDTTNTI